MAMLSLASASVASVSVTRMSATQLSLALVVEPVGVCEVKAGGLDE